jgi:hypothetical protein
MKTSASNLRRMIDSSCPVIFGGNWQLATEKGWRWECNLGINHAETPRIIENLPTDACETDRVTIGHPFSETRMRPEPVEEFIGVYLKDADDLVEAHAAELNDDEAFAAAVASVGEWRRNRVIRLRKSAHYANV